MDVESPALIGRVIWAEREPCNDNYDFETLPVRQQRLKLASGLSRSDRDRERMKYTERRVHKADVAITIALRHWRERLGWRVCLGGWYLIDGPDGVVARLNNSNEGRRGDYDNRKVNEELTVSTLISALMN